VAEKKRLGRGLSALIGERAAAAGVPATMSPELENDAGGGATGSGAAGGSRLRDLPVADIAPSPRQPRRSFDEAELRELADSIRSLGVVQPVVVRPSRAGSDSPWELVAGERRLRASKLAGVATVPALVRSVDEASALEIALAENVAREDLNAIEEAHAFAALADEFGLTHGRIGEMIGKSRVAVTNVLRLLELPDEVQLMIETAELSEGHGRALLALSDHGARRKLARLVVKQGLTVRQTEALVRKTQAGAPPARARPARDTAFDDLADELYGLLEAPVRIRTGKRGGKLEVSFKDRAELDRLLELLRRLGP